MSALGKVMNDTKNVYTKYQNLCIAGGQGDHVHTMLTLTAKVWVLWMVVIDMK